MLPVIAIVGRPNVGKSTLFNRLTKTRAALVASVAGLTRDRQYGQGKLGERACMLIDTGGFMQNTSGIDTMVGEQTQQAIAEADSILFIVDARDGLHPDDIIVAKQLRKQSKPCLLVVNKTDGLDTDIACVEFHSLGLGTPYPIAAAHGRGITQMAEVLFADVPEVTEMPEMDADAIHIAVVGRPNVGKSTLVNRMLGEDRLIVFDEAGTTRDSIFVPLTHRDRPYVLIDTAGVRRKYKHGEAIEHFSVIKSMQAVKMAQVVIMVIDARSNIVEQDLSLLGYILETGKALVLAVNKWDGLVAYDKDRVRSELQRRLPFLYFTKPVMISALHGTGVGDLFKYINKAYACAMIEMPTAQLNKILEQAVQAHQPPLVHGRRIKLRYAHTGGHNPPTVVIHGNQTNELPRAYVRYLENTFSKALQLTGTPFRIELRNSDNPFAGRKNKLTPRQVQKRKRLLKHVKKRK